MILQMIGTGNAFSKKYDNNNALLQTSDQTLLIDCGITLPFALYRQGYSFSDLNGVLISHIHADHVGGLEEYAFQMKFSYPDSPKPKLYIAETLIAPLWEHTLRGGLAQDDFHSLDDFFDVVPLATGNSYTIGIDLTVELFETRHIPGKQSYSFLLNKETFYTADMCFEPKLLEELMSNGVKTIFHDCQLESPGVVHTSLEQLLSLPKEMQQHIMLMHYNDTKDNYIGRTGEMTFVERGIKYSLP